jgi:hypothetical protein
MKPVRAALCVLIILLGGIPHPTLADSGCTLTPPTDPEPGNLDTVAADSVTLRWKANCATAYELRIDDQAPINLTIPEYAFNPHQGIVNWRVIAFDGDGHHAEGSNWTFEVASENWLATPIPISQANLLYQPPLNATVSPRDLILAGCAMLLVSGLLLLAATVILRSRSLRRADKTSPPNPVSE